MAWLGALIALLTRFSVCCNWFLFCMIYHSLLLAMPCFKPTIRKPLIAVHYVNSVYH